MALKNLPLTMLVLILSTALVTQADEELALTPEERDWLDDHPVLRHAPDPDYAPFEWRREDGSIDGIATQLLDLVAARLNVRIDRVISDSWQESLENVRARRADLVTVAAKTPERAEYMNFTQPYVELPDVIIVRQGGPRSLTLDDLAGMRVAIIKGWGSNQWLEGKAPRAKFREVPDIATGLRGVSFGSLDAIVLGIAAASHGIEENKITNLRIAGETGWSYRLSFACRNDWPLLHSILDKAILSIPESKREQVMQEHLHLIEDGWRLETGHWWALAGGLITLFLALTILWNQALRRQVHRKTVELGTARDLAEKTAEELSETLSMSERLRKQAQEAEAQSAISNEAKGTFLAQMSHELRTPLNGILGTCEALLESIYGAVEDRQRKALRTIDRAGRHLLSLVNDLLDIARIEAGRFQPNLEPVSIVKLSQEVLSMMRKRAEQEGITLHLFTDGKSDSIHSDARRIRQILINLVGNAVKFTPQGGRVSVEIHGTEQEIRLSVHDTGVGLAKDQLETIFEPFVQIDSPLSRRHAGTGLGLNLTSMLTRALQGRMLIASKVGQGSRFTLCFRRDGKAYEETFLEIIDTEDDELPTRDQELLEVDSSNSWEEVTSTSLELDIESHHSPPHILLVDDQPENVRSIRDLLENRGYRVTVAHSGEEALHYAQVRPDVIFMDISMPGIGGLETIQRLRAEAETLDIYIVALTSFAMAEDRQRCLDAGANDHQTKPISRAKLFECLEKRFERRGEENDIEE